MKIQIDKKVYEVTQDTTVETLTNQGLTPDQANLLIEIFNSNL